METSGIATRFGWSARPSRGDTVQVAVITALMLFALFGLPSLLSLYWIDTSTTTVIYAIVALGLGVLVGRVGMISLGQVAVLALGHGSRRSSATPPRCPTRSCCSARAS